MSLKPFRTFEAQTVASSAWSMGKLRGVPANIPAGTDVGIGKHAI
ncbi:hypothetical protein [Arthrobacter sp. zg-Y877]|nr:hypothetical protein [Arthrobacter sp. zg-Y877]MDM7990714.1 hypothetical protein [Arthrobacter sp. zg-Y877]